LATSGRPVIGFVVLDLWTSGTFPLIAALGTLMTVISVTAVAIALYLGKSRAAARARG
jgi:iron(III) transport system permease protein